MKDTIAPSSNQVSDASVTVESLAERFKLPLERFAEHGVYNRRNGTVGISYGRGNRGRCRTADPGSRFRWDRAGKPEVPYGTAFMEPENDDYPILCEGESDCWAGWHHNYWLIGMPGANTAYLLKLEHLRGRELVYIHQEPGESGEAFVRGLVAQLKKIGYTGAVKVISVHDFCQLKDIADLHVDDPAMFAPRLEMILARAVDAPEPEPEPFKPSRPLFMRPLTAGHDVDCLHDLRSIISGDAVQARSDRWVCPFHADSVETANLCVYTSRKDGRQRYKCHSAKCGACGDILDWVMKLRGVPFLEACRELGVEPEIEQRGRKMSRLPDCKINSPAIATKSEIQPAAEPEKPDELFVPMFCPNSFKTNGVILQHKTTLEIGDLRKACGHLDCPYCRLKWNHKRIAHFTEVVEKHGDLLYNAGSPLFHQIIDLQETKWGTVKQRLDRAGAEYFGIKFEPGKVHLYCTAEIKGSEQVADVAAATELMQEEIKSVKPCTEWPILASKKWHWEYDGIEAVEKSAETPHAEPSLNTGEPETLDSDATGADESSDYAVIGYCRATWEQVLDEARRRGYEFEPRYWEAHDAHFSVLMKRQGGPLGGGTLVPVTSASEMLSIVQGAEGLGNIRCRLTGASGKDRQLPKESG